MTKRTILSIILIFCFIINIFTNPLTGYASNIIYQETVYIDGVKFMYQIDNEGNISVISLGKHAGTKLNINKNGEAYAVERDENGKKQEYILDIQDLSKSKVNVEIYNKQHKKVEEYKSIHDLRINSYTGQVAFSGLVSVLGLALQVVVVLTLTVCVGGLVYYVGTKAYEAIKEKEERQKKYFPAVLSDGSVYVAYFNPITKKEAGNRIRNGKNIYAFTKSRAKKAVLASGYACSKREIDKNRTRGKLYFYHFHTNPKNGAHAWYGIPYTG